MSRNSFSHLMHTSFCSCGKGHIPFNVYLACIVGLAYELVCEDLEHKSCGMLPTGLMRFARTNVVGCSTNCV